MYTTAYHFCDPRTITLIRNSDFYKVTPVYVKLIRMMILNAMARWSIELGDFRLNSATSLGDVVWFLGGILALAGLTTLMLRRQRRASPDPFA